MKVTIFFLVVFFVICTALKPEERRAAEKKILDECKQLVQATDDDVDAILDRKTPQTHNGKCLLKCTYERAGIIINEEFSIDALKALGEKELQNDPKALEILKEMIAECESVTDSDICEQSSQMESCMIEAGVKRGIDPMKGIQESIGSM